MEMLAHKDPLDHLAMMVLLVLLDQHQLELILLLQQDKQLRQVFHTQLVI